MSLLTLDAVSLGFGGIKAVDAVSFDVDGGEIFTIIGPNGAGKTTIFNLLSRLYDPSAGRILVDGEDVTRLPAHAMASRGVARTFQNIELFESATVLRNVLLGSHVHRTSNLWEDLFFLPGVRARERALRRDAEVVLDFLELHAYRDAVIRDLPYGVRKIVEIARALCTRPRLILLDEPSSGLNLEETDDLAFWIRDIKEELGITVLMIEHDMRLVSAVSDRVMAMSSGRVVATGSAEAVQRDPEVLRTYLGGAA